MFRVRAREATTVAPTLLERLGQALEAAGVIYCQWKGHWKRTRWESGAGDIDLLVDSAWADRLEIELGRLGFKPAVAPLEAQIPGTESWIGFDADRLSLAHVHLHRRLIVGGYWTTVYRLAMERAVLDSAVPRFPFPVPAPELEFIMFVLRTVQRYSPRDILAPRQPRWLADTQPEFTYLRNQVDRDVLVARLAELLPSVDVAFFDACTRSLAPQASRWTRLWLRRGLQKRLEPHASHPPLNLLVRRIGRSLRLLPRARGLHPARGAGGGHRLPRAPPVARGGVVLPPHHGPRSDHSADGGTRDRRAAQDRRAAGLRAGPFSHHLGDGLDRSRRAARGRRTHAARGAGRPQDPRLVGGVAVARSRFVLEVAGPAGSGKTTVTQLLTARPHIVSASVWNLPKPLYAASAVRALPAIGALIGASRWIPREETEQLIRLEALDVFLSGLLERGN